MIEDGAASNSKEKYASAMDQQQEHFPDDDDE